MLVFSNGMPILTIFATVPSSSQLSPVMAAYPWLGDTVVLPKPEGPQEMHWTQQKAKPAKWFPKSVSLRYFRSVRTAHLHRLFQLTSVTSSVTATPLNVELTLLHNLFHELYFRISVLGTKLLWLIFRIPVHSFKYF